MKILVSKENMYLMIVNAGTLYTFYKEESTDISDMKVSDYVKLKNRIEERENCQLELCFQN